MSVLVLGSGSSIRADLLKAAGLTFFVQTADVDERALEETLGDAAPATLAEALAAAKATAVCDVLSETNPNAFIIGADQVLSIDGEILHKAPDTAAARAKLMRLQGDTHQLTSAAAIVQDRKVLWSGSQSAQLCMRTMSQASVDAYLSKAGDASTASVGAYRLEELGASLFQRIEGDYFTILGLPLLPLLAALRAHGIDPLGGNAA
jgi:septum formation protein